MRTGKRGRPPLGDKKLVNVAFAMPRELLAELKVDAGECGMSMNEYVRTCLKLRKLKPTKRQRADIQLLADLRWQPWRTAWRVWRHQ